MGKDNPHFQRHVAPAIAVHIVNASKLALTQEKRENKRYARYSGYPGGLRTETLGSLVERRGYAEALRRAVHGMLPSNKLRSRMLKNLIIEE